MGPAGSLAESEDSKSDDVEWVSEQREYARVETDLGCIVDGETDGRIRNLSLGGALLFAPAGFADIDDTVSIEFQAGEAEPLTLFGEVLRFVNHGKHAAYGIQFVAVEPQQQENLVRCIELLASGKGPGSRCRRFLISPSSARRG